MQHPTRIAGGDGLTYDSHAPHLRILPIVRSFHLLRPLQHTHGDRTSSMRILLKTVPNTRPPPHPHPQLPPLMHTMRRRLHPKCSLCPPTVGNFSTVAALNQHTQETHFPCANCFVFFASEGQRAEHLRREHPTCDVCFKPCASRASLRSHRARRHPEYQE